MPPVSHTIPPPAAGGRWVRRAVAAALALGVAVGCRPAETPAPAAVLQPGEYVSPLTRLQRIEGQIQHLHVDEVRTNGDGLLAQCSYTFGVLDVKDPANVRYLAENLKHKIPDVERTPGCIHLAWDGDIVYTTHRGNLSNATFLSGWDISKKDPADTSGTRLKPEQLPVLQEPGISYEGVDVANGHIFVALRENGLGVYRRDPATNEIRRVGGLDGLGNTWGLRAVGDRVYLTDIGGGLEVVDAADPTRPKRLGRAAVDGVPRGLTVDGTTAYVAAGPAGLVVVDAADPAAPRVIGQAATPGTAIRADYSNGRVFLAAWNDTRAYDVSNPAQPRFIAATRQTQQSTYGAQAGDLDNGRPPVTVRTLGVAANDDIVYVGNWWVLYTYRLRPERQAPNLLLPEDANTIDFGPVAAGETKTVPLELTNQGTAPLTLYHNWTEGEAFSVAPAQVRVAPGEKATLQISYTPSEAAAAAEGGDLAPEWSNLHLRSDDPEHPERVAFLTANRPGLGLGRPLPETRVDLLGGGEWSSADHTGNVQLLAYFATF